MSNSMSSFYSLKKLDSKKKSKQKQPNFVL